MAVQSVSATIVKNTDWIAQAFFTPTGAGGAGVQIQPVSSALMTLYDTTPGGNRSINPPYQYGRHSDIRQPSLASGSKGMGTYYSDAHDSKATRVSMRFGIPKFNPLSRFLSNYYDKSLAELTNTGQVTSSIFSSYTIGKTLGTLFTLPLQVYFGISYLYNRVTSFITGRPYNQFFYMEPHMPMYWTAVTTLVNKVTTSLGITHGYDASDLTGTVSGAVPSKVSATLIKQLNQMLPDVFRVDSESVIDVKAVASRAQRLQNEYYSIISRISEDKSLTYDQFVSKIQSTLIANSVTGKNTSGISDLTEYLSAYSASPLNPGSATNTSITPQTDAETDSTNDSTATTSTESTSNNPIYSTEDEPGFMSFLNAELLDGSAFVTFDVDYNGAIGESFSSSTRSTGLEETLNGIATKHRNLMVNFANGNVGDGLIAGAFEKAAGMVKGLAEGALASIGFAGLSQLDGGGFAAIQDVWDQSTANLATESYHTRLVNPHGDKISFLISIVIPLCCLLAGGLPRTTGSSAYGSPFICSIDSHGRNRVSRGIIDSIQISRGTSNVGFTNQGLPAVVDVTWTVKNLDKIMHVPVTDSFVSTLTSFSQFEEDNALSDYLSSLAAVSLYDRFYMGPRIRMAWANAQANWDSMLSASNFAQYAATSAPGQIVAGILRASPNLKGL